MGYRIHLDRDALMNARACVGGLDFLEWLGSSKGLSVEVTPLHEFLMATQYPEITEWLRGKRVLRRPVFSGWDLEGRNLQGSFFRRADLSGVNLRGSQLNGADLRGAILCAAILEEADLTGARMNRALVGGAVRPEGWGMWREKEGVLVPDV